MPVSTEWEMEYEVSNPFTEQLDLKFNKKIGRLKLYQRS